jgi:hypothetical protein
MVSREVVVDLSYLGIAVAREAALERRSATSGFVAVPEPMPVGTELELRGGDGIALRVRVAAVREVCAGMPQTTGGMEVELLEGQDIQPWDRLTGPEPAPADGAVPGAEQGAAAEAGRAEQGGAAEAGRAEQGGAAEAGRAVPGAAQGAAADVGGAAAEPREPASAAATGTGPGDAGEGSAAPAAARQAGEETAVAGADEAAEEESPGGDEPGAPAAEAGKKDGRRRGKRRGRR